MTVVITLERVMLYRRVVGIAHHPGRRRRSARAASLASRSVSNNPNTVAPEPDMRARRQPVVAAIASTPVEIGRAHV